MPNNVRKTCGMDSNPDVAASIPVVWRGTLVQETMSEQGVVRLNLIDTDVELVGALPVAFPGDLEHGSAMLVLRAMSQKEMDLKIKALVTVNLELRLDTVKGRVRLSQLGLAGPAHLVWVASLEDQCLLEVGVVRPEKASAFFSYPAQLAVDQLLRSESKLVHPNPPRIKEVDNQCSLSTSHSPLNISKSPSMKSSPPSELRSIKVEPMPLVESRSPSTADQNQGVHPALKAKDPESDTTFNMGEMIENRFEPVPSSATKDRVDPVSPTADNMKPQLTSDESPVRFDKVILLRDLVHTDSLKKSITLIYRSKLLHEDKSTEEMPRIENKAINEDELQEEKPRNVSQAFNDDQRKTRSRFSDKRAAQSNDVPLSNSCFEYSRQDMEPCHLQDKPERHFNQIRPGIFVHRTSSETPRFPFEMKQPNQHYPCAYKLVRENRPGTKVELLFQNTLALAVVQQYCSSLREWTGSTFQTWPKAPPHTFVLTIMGGVIGWALRDIVGALVNMGDSPKTQFIIGPQCTARMVAFIWQASVIDRRCLFIEQPNANLGLWDSTILTVYRSQGVSDLSFENLVRQVIGLLIADSLDRPLLSSSLKYVEVKGISGKDYFHPLTASQLHGIQNESGCHVSGSTASWTGFPLSLSGTPRSIRRAIISLAGLFVCPPASPGWPQLSICLHRLNFLEQDVSNPQVIADYVGCLVSITAPRPELVVFRGSLAAILAALSFVFVFDA